MDQEFQSFNIMRKKSWILIKAERALIAELLNRGPQTTGELNTRASRMFHFDGLEDVEDTLAGYDGKNSIIGGNNGPPPRSERRRDGSINLGLLQIGKS